MSDWIRSNVEIIDHPKMHVLCSSMNERIPYVIGTLHLLWHFAMRYAWRDGDLSRFGAIAIARACHIEDDPELFVARLQEAGFLDGLKVHDWLETAGRLVQDRLRYRKANRIRTQAVRKPSAIRPEHVANVTLRTLRTRRDVTDVRKSTPSARVFLKPTAEEVMAYAKTMYFQLDGAKFVDFYESKGWLVGKSPMRDWRAAVRTWKRNGYGSSNGSGGYVTPVHPPPKPPSKEERELSDAEHAEMMAEITKAKALLKPKPIPK